jgi:hypothetical protein
MLNLAVRTQTWLHAHKPLSCKRLNTDTFTFPNVSNISRLQLSRNTKSICETNSGPLLPVSVSRVITANGKQPTMRVTYIAFCRICGAPCCLCLCLSVQYARSRRKCHWFPIIWCETVSVTLRVQARIKCCRQEAGGTVRWSSSLFVLSSPLLTSSLLSYLHRLFHYIRSYFK